MTLREAAERTSRSITTLRRYIRSGRLRAEKRYGRFGPEYHVSEPDLIDAGLDTEPIGTGRALSVPGGRRLPQADEAGPGHRSLMPSVPLSLFEDLQMKHEQLLVQYGMVRAGGLRAMELQAELETKQKELDEARQLIGRLRRRWRSDAPDLRQALRKAHLELQGRGLEIEALQEKVRALEMLTRNAVTTEAIESQFRRVLQQSQRVGRLDAERRREPEPRAGSDPPSADGPDH